MQASADPSPVDQPPQPIHPDGNTDEVFNDEERAVNNRSQGSSSNGESTDIQTRAASVVSSSSQYLKKKTSQLIGAITPTSQRGDKPIPPKLAELVHAFESSEDAASLKAEFDEIARESVAQNGDGALPDVALENSLTRGRKRASWGTQFRILSGRAFKNLYRDPALLAAHYISSVIVAREYGCSM